MDKGREERLAFNEALFRDVNTRLEAIEGPALGTSSVVCECARLSCRVKIAVEQDEYRAVRGHPLRFIVFPGHEKESIERVVGGERPRYLVVEKIGRGKQVARETDPERPE